MSSFSTQKFLSGRIFCIRRNVRNLNSSLYVKLLLILFLFKVQKKTILLLHKEANIVILYDYFVGQRKLIFVVSGQNMSAEILNNLKAVKILLKRSLSKLHIHEV